MTHKRLALQGVLSALGVVVYTSLVSLFMINAESFFGREDTFITPLIALTLLVFSVAVVGLLIFGRPAYLIVGGHKKEGLQLLAYAIATLFVCLILIMLTAAAVYAPVMQ